jgi:hypothetical protein
MVRVRCVESPTLDTVLTNTFQVTAGQHSAKVRKAKLITALADARHMLPRRVVVVDVPSSISMCANAVHVVHNLAKDISTYVPYIVILSRWWSLRTDPGPGTSSWMR